MSPTREISSHPDLEAMASEIRTKLPSVSSAFLKSDSALLVKHALASVVHRCSAGSLVALLRASIDSIQSVYRDCDEECQPIKSATIFAVSTKPAAVAVFRKVSVPKVQRIRISCSTLSVRDGILEIFTDPNEPPIWSSRSLQIAEEVDQFARAIVHSIADAVVASEKALDLEPEVQKTHTESEGAKEDGGLALDEVRASGNDTESAGSNPTSVNASGAETLVAFEGSSINAHEVPLQTLETEPEKSQLFQEGSHPTMCHFFRFQSLANFFPFAQGRSIWSCG